MDFYECVAEYLLEHLNLDSFSRDITGDKEILFQSLEQLDSGVAILDLPSETGIRFLDRSRTYNLNFQVSVNNRNQTTARHDAFKIYQELDDLPRPDVTEFEQSIFSKNDSFILKVCEGINLPHLTSITEKESFIYTMNIKAELFIKTILGGSKHEKK